VAVVYDRNSSSFRGEKGRYISNAEVLRLVDAEVARQETRLKGHARLLINGRIDIPEFQRRMAGDMKASAIRMAALGAGGVDGLGNRHYGKVGSELKKQYKFLAGFGNALANGLTEKQVLQRAGQYSRQSAISFHAAQQITKEGEGFIEGRRSLDGQAQHCKQCLDYSTNGQWVPLSELIAVGSSCDCGGRCRCRIVFRKASLSDVVKEKARVEAAKAKAEKAKADAEKAKAEKAKADAEKAAKTQPKIEPKPESKAEDEARFSGGMKSRPVVKEDLERALSRQMRAASHHSDLLNLEGARGTPWEQRAQNKVDRSKGSYHNALSKLKPGVSLDLLDNNIWINNEVVDSLGKKGVRGLVVTKDGQLAASASYQIKKGYIEVDYLAAAPRTMFEGGQSGSGRAMIEALVAESRQQGFEGEIRLEALESAEGFYQKMGFERIRSRSGEGARYKLSKEAAQQHYRD